MNIRVTLYSVFFLFFFSSIDMSAQQMVLPTPQTEEDAFKMKNLRDRWNLALGTFQIQIVNTRINPQIDVSVIEQIEQARKEEQINYIPLGDNIRVMILPKSEINKADYKKLDPYKYIAE